MNKISIPIDSEIIAEFFLRSGPKANICNWIEDIIMDYLERTKNDDGWQEGYYEYIEKQESYKDYGDPDEGYQWKQLFLPNGTKIFMPLRQKKYQAIVEHGKFIFNGIKSSPSKFANSVAGHNRNAWLDLYIKRPKDVEPVLADRLRLRHQTVS
jgi:hypothetical protein